MNDNDTGLAHKLPIHQSGFNVRQHCNGSVYERTPVTQSLPTAQIKKQLRAHR